MSKKGAPGTKGLNSGKVMELVLAAITLINLVIALILIGIVGAALGILGV